MVRKKLTTIGIEMDDESLVDYITLITLDSRKTPDDILTDLDHFMAEDSHEFVRWMTNLLHGMVPIAPRPSLSPSPYGRHSRSLAAY